MITAVTVFCGSQSGNRPEYAGAARRLGQVIASRKLELVYGAGNIGLMGIVADAALEAGGRVVGVIPHALVQRELAHMGCSELIRVNTMHERKAIMADRASAFIALPGGFGTLDELFEILTWSQLGIHSCPVGLLDTCGYYHTVLAWIDHAIAEGFLKAVYRERLLVAEEPEELLERLLNAPQQEKITKWIGPEQR
jgi:hypothetical protein